MATEKRLVRLSDLLKFPIRINHYDKEHGNEDFVLGIETVMEYAENLPTVDAVEVVFCDECENCGNCFTESIFRLARIEKPFCCVGKRKTNSNCVAKMDCDGNG